MYTGLITEVGAVVDVDPDGVVVAGPKTAAGLRPGGSVDVSGVCLTATEVGDHTFRVGVSAETRRRSVAGEWRPAAEIFLWAYGKTPMTRTLLSSSVSPTASALSSFRRTY